MTTNLPAADFDYVSREVKARSGLVLTPDKAYLLDTRLSPIARKEGFLSVQELVTTARARRDERLLSAVTDALTTNETFFFRDKTPFDLFKDVMAPELARKRAAPARLRIWCAACSTGQEPYSLAILLEELRAEGRGLDCEIVATDISERVLEKARAGLYSQFEVQRGLPIQMLMRYFEKTGDMWRASDRLRALVRFQKFNLLEEPRALGRFDIVFCRNVLIYFDAESKRAALERIASVLAEDGYLVLGGAETVMGVTDTFAAAPDKRGLYMRNAKSRRAA